MNPLKSKIVQIIFKNPVRTSKRTPHFTNSKINWLMLFKEIIAVKNEKRKEPINIKCRLTDYESNWDIHLPLWFKGLIPDQLNRIK
jgi:hypothetical protein